MTFRKNSSFIQIALDVFIGINEDEKLNKQKIDVILYARNTIITQDNVLTVAHKYFSNKKPNLIEYAAAKIAKSLLSTKSCRFIYVKIAKPSALKNAKCSFAKVLIAS